jgi:peptidoglycan/LPS O-acetylase OafA/YrhL
LGNWLLIFSVIVFLVAYTLGANLQSLWSSVIGFSLVAIGYALVLLAAISPNCFLYRWKSKTTSFIAAISYSTYLTHKGIIHLTRSNLPNVFNSTTVFLFSVITCTIAAYLLHVSIEKTFLKWRNKLVKKERIENKNTLKILSKM